MFSRILVCLDGSVLAEQILPYVAEQAKRFCSKVILFEVLTGENDVVTPTTPTGEPMPQAAHVSVERAEEDSSNTRVYLHEVAEQLRCEGLDDIETYSVFDPFPGQTIVEFAHTKDIDLIVLTTHGRTGLGRVIFGSVADHVIRESHLPILLLKPQDVR